MDKVDIVVTDDHKLFRKGIMSLLSDFDFVENIYEAGNGKELLDLISQLEKLPEIVMLDLRMPEMDGFEAQRQIKELYPSVKVIILTMEDDEQFIIHLVHEGINGYLLKNADPEEMEMALKKTIANGFYFSHEISDVVLRGLVNQTKTKLAFMEEFSDREKEVLELLCKEYTAPEIADLLSISVRTVEGYRSKLIEKCGVKNIAGLVLFAYKNRLVDL